MHQQHYQTTTTQLYKVVKMAKSKDIELPKIAYGKGEPSVEIKEDFYIDLETNIMYEKKSNVWQEREKFKQEFNTLISNS